MQLICMHLKETGLSALHMESMGMNGLVAVATAIILPMSLFSDLVRIILGDKHAPLTLARPLLRVLVGAELIPDLTPEEACQMSPLAQ